MGRAKRRIFLIDKPFQIKYVLLLFTMLLFQTMVVLISIFLPQILAMTFGASLDEKIASAQTFLLLHQVVWPGVILSMIMLSGLSIFITHKIAGPVFRIKKDLQSIIDGNLNLKIVLRKNDELHDLADRVNNLTDIIRDFFDTLDRNHTVMNEQLAEIDRQVAVGTIPAAVGNELMARIKDNRKQTEQLLQKYHSEKRC